jgi:hypothetical protein
MDEIVGQWWFEGEDERHPGNLKVDKDRIELQLNHGVVDEHITEWVRRGRGNILGRASDGRPISLLGCSETRVSQSLDRYLTSTFRCEEMFYGMHQTSSQAAQFASIDVTFDLGAMWAGERAYDAKSGEEDGIDHHFAVLFDVTKPLLKQETPDGIVEFLFRNMPDFLSVDFSIRSPLFLRISNPAQPKTYWQWRRIVEPYRWLLSLLMGRTMRIDSAHVTSSEGEGQSSASVVPPFPSSEARKNISPAISFHALKAEFSTLLERWLPVADKYAPACELLLDEDKFADLPLRFDFLLHAQVLEAIYRRGIYERRAGKLLEDYKPVRTELLAVIESHPDETFRKVATAKINQFNELPLRAQHERFFETFHSATLDGLGLTEDAKADISEIRHHLTHSGRDENEKRIVTPGDIYVSTRRLRFFSFVYLLKEAGLYERDCVYHLGGMDYFRWLVDFDAFNHPRHVWPPEEYGRSTTKKYLRNPS